MKNPKRVRKVSAWRGGLLVELRVETTVSHAGDSESAGINALTYSLARACAEVLREHGFVRSRIDGVEPEPTL